MRRKFFILFFFVLSLALFVYGVFFDKTKVYSFAGGEPVLMDSGRLLERSIFERIARINGKYYDCDSPSFKATADLPPEAFMAEVKKPEECSA